MKKLLLFTLILMFHVTASGAEGFSTLEERMSGKEFKETGLSRLTDEELAILNDWIRRHSVATLDNASAPPASAMVATQGDAATDDRGFENRPKFGGDKKDKIIYGNIEGTFTGWTGNNNKFKLTNGMVWEQTEGGTFTVPATDNAEITIEKGFLGGWRLSMVGYNKTVAVKRIK